MTNPAQEAVNTHGKIWIGSPRDVRYGKEAETALQETNDNEYWNDFGGIITVDEDRWKLAQKFEKTTWEQNQHVKDDRNHEHSQYFNDYQDLPPDLGNVIEIGCGPFTQLQTILKGRTADRVTLLDPLIESYLRHPNCAYKDRKFQGFQTELIQAKAEDCNIEGEFDTVICINTLEHVQDASNVLVTLNLVLKTGGILIFADRYYDGLDIKNIYDVGHPIRVTKCILDAFSMAYTPILSESRPGDCLYFIGRKN